MKFIGILLKEGRKEDLKKKYSTKFNEQDLDFILNISDLGDFNHKYTDFVLKNTDGDGELDTDELEHLIGLIKDFDKYQSQFPKKDINQYVSLNELEKVILYVRAKNKEKELEKQVDKIYEDDKFLVVIPKSEEASCKYGSNTKWCVTSKGSGHFGRYTSGNQFLYFIINKTNSTNQSYSKVAIHFDDYGNTTYWDAQDSPMTKREIDVLEYAFPELIKSITDHHEKQFLSKVDAYLKQVFNSNGENLAIDDTYLSTDMNLDVSVVGFDSDTQGHATGSLVIWLVGPDGVHKTIDVYEIYLMYESYDEKTFEISVGFVGDDDFTSEDAEDLGLESFEISSKYYLGSNPSNTANGVRDNLAKQILSRIKDNPKLVKKVIGDNKVWRPDRANYGYTFNKNKGLIKQLVDFLDKGTIGTKLDFLESIGKLKSKTVDGKKYYSKNGNYLPSSDWRGYFSSFFASARMAGILNYRKVGKDYLLTKGPNFEAFKSGDLKAL
jgi:hypothetical protein